MASVNSTASIKNQPFDFKYPPHWAWDYASAKGYIGGCQSGKAAAIAYIKYAEQREYVDGACLQFPAIRMAEMLAKAVN